MSTPSDITTLLQKLSRQLSAAEKTLREIQTLQGNPENGAITNGHSETATEKPALEKSSTEKPPKSDPFLEAFRTQPPNNPVILVSELLALYTKYTGEIISARQFAARYKKVLASGSTGQGAELAYILKSPL